MEQISCARLPTNKKNLWLLAQFRDDNEFLNFYTIQEKPSNHRCRIPELLGRHIQGFSHGWVILSNHPHDVLWSLWNPVTSKLIRLPQLVHRDEGDLDNKISYCWLSSPPSDPSSILLLKKDKKPNFVFCRLDPKRKRSRWTEMSYAKQLKRATGEGGILDYITCCNGKLYALSNDALCIVQIDIKVNDKQVVIISLSRFDDYPCFDRLSSWPFSNPEFYVLKGSSTELFVIVGRFEKWPAAVYVFKRDMTSTPSIWKLIYDLKDAVFFVDLCDFQSVSYIPKVSPGLGGYVYIHDYIQRGTVYSYRVKDRTISLLPMPCLAKSIRASLWEYELEGDDRQAKLRDDNGQDKEKDQRLNTEVVECNNMTNESRLLDVPFHVLEMIMDNCVGIEYMNLRATCKRCHLAAPSIKWRNKTVSRKLQNYSLVTSPWLMVIELDQKLLKFTDPVSGDEYFMNTSEEVSVLPYLYSISCSNYGWLLFYNKEFSLVFFNHFTNDIRKLPRIFPHIILENLCFSAPPTSPNCMVVGFSTEAEGHAAYILRYANQGPLLWHRFNVDYDKSGGHCDYRFPTFCGRDLYALCSRGQVVVFKDMSEDSFSQPQVVAAEPPRCPSMYSSEYFLVKSDPNLVLVIVGKHGGDPQLFQLNESTGVWNRIKCLERHVIFIGGATCVCIEAKTPEMENKIYFPRSKNGKLMFYSLETSNYHTIDGKAIGEACPGYDTFYNTIEHLSFHAWIEPTWC